jgi:hypothetical protein
MRRFLTTTISLDTDVRKHRGTTHSRILRFRNTPRTRTDFKHGNPLRLEIESSPVDLASIDREPVALA